MIEPTATGVVIDVKVVPNSSREQVAGPLGDALKVKVAAPPEAGKANNAVCELLAAALGVEPRRVTVITGHTTPRKRVAVEGIDEAAARGKLTV